MLQIWSSGSGLLIHIVMFSYTVSVVHLTVILIWCFDNFGFDRQIQCTPTLLIIMSTMSISQTIYPQYGPDRQTKCLPICITFEFVKLNGSQIYLVYGTTILQQNTLPSVKFQYHSTLMHT